MDADEDDFVFYGTPVEREEDFTSRKKKALAESSGNVRSLPVWKQEVTDEEGRRRFHGAFTGGYSAGYYNTVGSKEGWAPQSFVSSRKSRAEVKQQSFLNFLDEDEKAELDGRSLKTSSQFDTFGFTSADLARKQAEKEQQKRPSAIPGPVPDEFIFPATESIGVKLLKKMGWRHGHSIKDSHTSSLYEARREARKALLAFSSAEAKVQYSNSEPTDGEFENVPELPVDAKSSKSTPVYVLNPKQDLHGLGYDPYKHAPEFREKKRLRTSGGIEHVQERSLLGRESLFGFKSGNIAPGFGIGALEELDAEDEDVYASGYNFVESLIEEAEEPIIPSLDMKDTSLKLKAKEHDGILPGFKVASKSDYQLERFYPPEIPKDFDPKHKFPGPFDMNQRLFDPPPLEVPPPQDHQLKVLIDGVASLVARCGKSYEDLSKEKNQSDPRYNFLNGGEFHDYYSRKLWEERQKRNQTKPLLESRVTSEKNMTAESRGRILGERPLGRSLAAPTSSDAPVDLKFQNNLVDTFTKSAVMGDLLDVSKPFKDDLAKQERFEQFLKDKYHGGLRATDSGSSNMSESARARERLDFEAAAEAIEKKARLGKESSTSAQTLVEFSAGGTMQFTAGGFEQPKPIQAEDPVKKMIPKREEFSWRPSPILCKRFDLIDPYMGKPPPAPRARSKMDSLFFMPDPAKASGSGEIACATTKRNQLSEPQSKKEEIDAVVDKEPEVQAEIENVERPVDLYKAIFSDDSEDEEEETETPIINNAENPEKKVEAANAVLSRLIAGDFLESLGKELGLEVPPDLPPPNKTKTTVSQKDAVVSATSIEESTEKRLENDFYRRKSGEASVVVMMHRDDKKVEKASNHRESSSEDEKRSRRSKKHRYSDDSEGEEASEDSRDRYHSSSKKKNRKKESSSSSRNKHSKAKHRKHGSRDSPERSHHRSSERDRSETKRDNKRRYRGE